MDINRNVMDSTMPILKSPKPGIRNFKIISHNSRPTDGIYFIWVLAFFPYHLMTSSLIFVLILQFYTGTSVALNGYITLTKFRKNPMHVVHVGYHHCCAAAAASASLKSEQ